MACRGMSFACAWRYHCANIMTRHIIHTKPHAPPTAASPFSRTYSHPPQTHSPPAPHDQSCTHTYGQSTARTQKKRRGGTHNLNTLGAYRVWMLYPSLCLVSPAITL